MGDYHYGEDKERRARLISCNNEIARHASKKELQQAISIFETMRAEDLANSHSYAAALNAYVRCGDIAGARKLFDEIRQSKRFKLDVISYTTMMKGYCTDGDIDNATQLLLAMTTSQPSILPNIRTMNTYFRGCVNTGSVFNAIAAFELMKTNFKIAPDVSTYESVIMLCCQALLLDIVLPMVGRIKSDESMKSGLTAMLYAVGRASAMVGDFKLMKKSLTAALESLSYINDEDNQMGADDGGSKRAVSGGKRSWHGQMEDSRHESLALFRSHKQEELAREINIISKYGEECGASDKVVLTLQQLLRVFSFSVDNFRNEVEADADAGDTGGVIDSGDDVVSPLAGMEGGNSAAGVVHHLLASMIERLGLAVLLDKVGSAASTVTVTAPSGGKPKQVSLSTITNYQSLLVEQKQSNSSKKKKQNNKSSTPSKTKLTVSTNADVQVPTHLVACLARIKQHLDQCFDLSGRMMFANIFSEFLVADTASTAASVVAAADESTASPEPSSKARPVHIEICSGAGEWVVAQVIYATLFSVVVVNRFFF